MNMVRDPRKYQKVMGWGLDYALNLLYDLFVSQKNKISPKELTQYFVGQMDGQVSSRKISSTVYELSRFKYIQFGEGDSVKLTDKARIKLIDKTVRDYNCDNKKRLVSFDIPEIKRKNRNSFRSAIKRMGFVQIQKSLWVCDRNVGDMVDVAAREYGVNDYVAYFVIESSNIESFINKKLNNKNKS